jgi:3-oxo-5alpha-steroid 4-dehydrogenase|tara:strand:+ start:647 stop:934 length:288 start_codon:yes stop_codon:yes gene_type:complete
MINKQAQRFINEDCYHGRVAYHVFRQLGDRVFFIVGADEFEKPVYLSADFAGTAETVAELAEEIGLNTEQLTHTIEFYNKNAAKDGEPLFHKSAE